VSTPKYASMAAADLKEGSNLFDNVNAKVGAFKFTKEAPENYTVEGNPIFAWVDLVLDGDGPEDDRKVNQSYSLGAMAGDHFTISDDGFGLVPNGDDASIRKDCKWGTFVSTLESMAGFPGPKLQAGDMSCLVGLYGHFKRIADKERNFSEDARTKPNQKKSKFPPSTLCCTKILALPGEAVKTGGTTATAPAAATTTASAPASAGPADVDGTAMEQILKVVGEKGSVQKSQLGILITKNIMTLANRGEIVKRATDEAYLTMLSDAGVIKFDPASKPQVVLKAA
jgi:hypothetical protein